MMVDAPVQSTDSARAEQDGIVSGAKTNLQEEDFIQPLNTLRKEDFVTGILQGNRSLLARAITLIESTAPKHQKLAQEILQELMPYTGGAVRVGITGVPGVGKSTFIESFGLNLCGNGRKVAVLAVDPSSQRSHGSILGDKTRMEHLSNHPNAFIRPSPSGNTLGGVARRTRETISLCEAFGFDVILVETVGVGQSETMVRDMVDYFLVLLLAGAGDDLQGIKKGIIEMGDGFLVTKADGDNRDRAMRTAVDLKSVLHLLSSPTPGWSPRAEVCSAKTGDGITDVWSVIEEFLKTTQGSEVFGQRRAEQLAQWFESLLQEKVINTFIHGAQIAPELARVRSDVLEGKVAPALAVENIVSRIVSHFEKN